MATRSRIFIFGSLIAPLAVYFGGSMTIERFDREGWRFFNTGKDIVTRLGEFSKAVQGKNTQALDGFYSPSFTGTRLGLTRLEQASEKDGARRLTFHSDGGSMNKDTDVAEWRAYLDSFESIEEA